MDYDRIRFRTDPREARAADEWRVAEVGTVHGGDREAESNTLDQHH